MVARIAQRGPPRRRAHPVPRTSMAHSDGHTCTPLWHRALLRVGLSASLLYLRCAACTLLRQTSLESHLVAQEFYWKFAKVFLFLSPLKVTQ